jgi:hypothetical protein
MDHHSHYVLMELLNVSGTLDKGGTSPLSEFKTPHAWFIDASK